MTEKIQPNDREISRMLRKQNFFREISHTIPTNNMKEREGDQHQKKLKPVFLVVNKCDNEERIRSVTELQ